MIITLIIVIIIDRWKQKLHEPASLTTHEPISSRIPCRPCLSGLGQLRHTCAANQKSKMLKNC